MYALKDKVTEKLSRLFADSPNSASSPTSPPDHSQARPYSKGGNSISAFFSYVVPSISFDGSKSKKPNQLEPDVTPTQSASIRWSSEDFDRRDDPFDSYEECTQIWGNDETSNILKDDKKCGSVCENEQPLATHDGNEALSGWSSSDSDVFEEATDQHSPRKLLPDLTEESAFISPNLYEFLQSSLPNIVKGCQWVLLYSTLKHGISLRTLIRNSAGLPGPCLLIVGDMQGAVFGGLLQCPLQPTPKRKYQGTNQTFVFTTIYGEPRLFRPTGANRYYYLCLNDLLALGGGGDFALRLDGDLLSGTSGACETFGNSCLAHNTEFELKNVELWGFTHVSRYLT